ncbi:MAG: alpha/beta hydrolase fold domain-containing protein [Bacilli bacterium]|nr:alpha/beta hydrolase fold domain-containing protein [Bacilli bacterium]
MEEVKLYRNMKEILHPSISKKNISNYIIVIDEDILPVHIFYPKKVSNLEKVIIFIHGNEKITECNYLDFYKLLSKNTDSVVISIEYEDTNYQEMYQSIYETIKYLHKGLIRNNIDKNKIVLMGDSTGANIITGINYLNKDLKIAKEILFYPVLSMNYEKASYESMVKNKDFNLGILTKLRNYYESINYRDDKLLKPLELDDYSNVPSTLILAGNVDSLKDEAKEYYDKLIGNNKYLELEFSAHGFLKKMDKDVEKEVFQEINKFLA